MSTPVALRQRRSRAHRAGDHSSCLPGRPCRATDTHDADGFVPNRGITAGRRLWRALGGDLLPILDQILLVEACRCLDRAEYLRRELDRASVTPVPGARRPRINTAAVERERLAQLETFMELCADLRAAGVSVPNRPPFQRRRSPDSPVTTHRRPR